MGAATEPAIRRAARIANGWFPQYGADEKGAEMVGLFRRFVHEAGRDPGDVPIEARIQYGDGDPGRWKHELTVWREREARYVSLVTMKAGLGTPPEHVGAIAKFMEVARG